MHRIEHTRSQSWPHRRGALLTTLMSLALACLGGALSSVVAAPPTFTEDFTTTTYMDADSTTALWDTGAGELKIAPFEITPVGTYAVPPGVQVAAAGDMAIVGVQDFGIHIVDITDLANPVLLGSYDTPNTPYGIAISGNYAYVADYTSLQVIDISDPTNPTFAGSYFPPNHAFDVAVSGDHAFVAVDAEGLFVLDISDPSNPTLVGDVDTPGNARGVDVAGNWVFVADQSAGLLMVSIYNPSDPELLGIYDTPGLAYQVEVAGDHAFVADGESGLHVIDITDPKSPLLEGSYDTPGTAFELAVWGDQVLIADGELLVIDVSNPSTPTLVDSHNTGAGPVLGVVVEGEHALLADYGSGLEVVKTSALTAPASAGFYGFVDQAQDVVVDGDHAFVAAFTSGLLVIDITDPTNPTQIGDYDTPGFASGVEVSGDFAYVADADSGLFVFDIWDPSNVKLWGSIDTPGVAHDVSVAGHHAFVADGESGLQVIDIGDFENPTLDGSYDTPGIATGVEIAGDYAFVADGSSGMQVIDISDPTLPTFVGNFDTSGGLTWNLAVAGDHVFLAEGGLLVIDVSDPANPAYVGGLDTPGLLVKDVAVAGDYVFLVDVGVVGSGLQAVDVSDPTDPRLAGSYELPNFPEGVVQSGEHAFVSTLDGLEVIQVFQRELLSSIAVGQSTDVDGASDGIPRARLTSTETAGISWELTADSGTTWSPITSDATWTRITTPGNDLRWRSTHTWEPGLNPTVSDLTLEWLNEFGPIAAVDDVPDDQGGWLRLIFDRSGYDFADEVELPVTGYGAYRRVDEALLQERIAASPAPSRVENEAFSSFDPSTIRRIDDAFYVVADGGGQQGAQGQFPPGVWEFISFQPATQQDDYISLVPTTADSSAGEGIVWSVYVTTTHTTTPSIWFSSNPDSGYSVDNIPPGVPANLMFNGPDVLEWDPAPEEDFAYHSVYGSETEVFDENAVLIDHTVDPTYDVSGAPYPFYHVTTSDHAGNESGAATIEMESTSAPEVPGLPTAFAFHPARPNPSRTGTAIGLDLPRPQPVELVVFDASGRRIREVVKGTLPAGRHRVEWDGMNDGGRRVTPGVYFARVTAGENRSSQRLIVVR